MYVFIRPRKDLFGVCAIKFKYVCMRLHKLAYVSQVKTYTSIISEYAPRKTCEICIYIHTYAYTYMCTQPLGRTGSHSGNTHQRTYRICTYTYIHMHIHTHIYMYAVIYSSWDQIYCVPSYRRGEVCMYVCMYIYIYIYMHTHMYVYMCVCVCMYVIGVVCMYVCPQAHTYS